MDLLATLAVLLGSAVGGAARYALSEWIAGRLLERFPWGILCVNVSGAGAIGVWIGAGGGAGLLEQLFVLGFLGSYTTVSTFALQALFLTEEGRTPAAASYVAASIGGCLTAALGGYLLGALTLGGGLA